MTFWIKKSLVLLMMAGLIYYCYHLLYKNDLVRSQNYPIDETPTVFVHGYKGTFNSFNSLLDRFENQYKWGKRGLICKVTKKGKVMITGEFPKDGDRLFIQVVFENNRATFKDTSLWLSKIMRTLKEHYGINKVNIVGHSMGGIVSTQYIQTYKNKHYPKVEKFVTIGSPFLGISRESYYKVNSGASVRDLRPQSKALKAIHQQKLPSSIHVLSIAGKGDQVVSVRSALALKKLAPKKKYKEVVIEDLAIHHSGLHESQEVDQLIGDFLWNQ
ncbi:putative alpha/beta hydrolase family protein [Oikeobacillus pervagus]|uniref:Alpha/beta hydrolase family protein n=1 Tax=Oikeobacillus pervagus TaxID=1325931 RepID=A0AAJ1SZ67_9BACI|nr:alpha/beta fold hydrolase [Oikeobacillus pervagus]MDQ0215324.1 putative alpha/beta hydrolase family protein [Oikeobacillus pervagus]